MSTANQITRARAAAGTEAGAGADDRATHLAAAEAAAAVAAKTTRQAATAA